MVIPQQMSTTALFLNILVAGIAFIKYQTEGYFSLRLILPFLISSVPLAFIGGMIQVSSNFYAYTLAIFLLITSIHLLIKFEYKTPIIKFKHPSIPLSVTLGGIIGFFSGMIGIGGGILLSPLMILMRWSDAKRTAAIVAFFIIVNSTAGLLGRLIQGSFTVGNILPFMLVAFFGGYLGSHLGSTKFSFQLLQKLLGIVLIIAAIKLFIS